MNRHPINSSSFPGLKTHPSRQPTDTSPDPEREIETKDRFVNLEKPADRKIKWLAP